MSVGSDHAPLLGPMVCTKDTYLLNQYRLDLGLLVRAARRRPGP